jgi:nitrate/nitrite transport system substrate-binding protein
MGTTTAENKPTPMYILCRLNLDCQAISVAKEYKGLGVTTTRRRSRRPSPRRRRPARK